ncbi:acyl-CoA dehydrogenase family protein [Nocardioides ungokensis]|uniref:acyl-CoA dehydrogenase family protein n=1 Tax=Nocardioides ungokensis TaxID=1643322 RepID=UPI0024842EC9|nr:acyl-CoA dehydrogenase family protein [Nocardioides ungokensis]
MAGGLDGRPGQDLRAGRGVDVQALRRRDRREGDRAGDADPRRQRLHPRLPRGALARDAKIYTIFEGTSEIQRLVIARSVSGAPIR